MPLVAAATIAYAAGLLAGFGTSLPATLGASVAAALVVAAGARLARERLALVALAVAGMSTAVAARGRETRCLERVLAESRWRLTLAGDATPGAFVPARHSCGASFRLAVRTGRASAGATVDVEGTPQRSRLGVLVESATLRERRGPDALARWRRDIASRIDRHFGEDAPIVRALLIADMQELSPTVRARFAAAGLSHMLSVSGLHVGLIAVAIALLGQLARVPKSRSDLLVVGVTSLYVAVIGAPLPAVRAAAMLAAHMIGRMVQRPTSPWAVLALGALLPLIDPRAVLDVGFQLSIVGMIALVAAGALHRRWGWLAQGGWRGTLYRGLAASTMATILTAPLVAATFGRVSLIAPLSNLVAAPLIALLQPMLFLAALLFPVAAAAQFVADACHPLLAGIDAIASFAARLPGSSLTVVADQLTVALAGAACAGFVVAAVSRFPGRPLVAGAACLAAIAWRPLIPVTSAFTELHVIDVGQGDAIALRTARGRWVLFDAGRDWQGGDEGQRDVIPYIAARGGPLVAFVLSHPHSDHVGGATSVLRALTPTWYFDPGYAGGTSPYRSSLAEARRLGTRWRRVRPQDSLVVDQAVITFLAPDSAWAESQGDPNLASSVVRIRVGEVAMLLTGDAEAPEERWLLRSQSGQLRADVLKVGHHGSRTSSTPEFLDAVRPRLAIVSVGAGNMYRHPSPEVMRSLGAHGAVTLRTDLDGSIVVRTDGHRISVDARGESWELRPRALLDAALALTSFP